MATKSYALTTNTRIKALLTITDSNFDTILKDYCYSVTDFIEKQCGRRFQRTTYTQELYDGAYIDGTRRNTLVLRNAPLVSISAFQYRTGTPDNPTWVDFQASQYVVDYVSGIIQVAMPPGMNNIRISYVAGYLIDFSNMYDDTLHTLPFDVVDICERLVTKKFKKRESEGKESETFQQSGIVWSKDMSDDDKQTLANYRRPFMF